MTTETKHTAVPWAVLQEECDKPYIRVRAALEMAREYASTALDEEREKFMGYEDIGMVASIQADLDSITDSLAALAEIERELDDERRKAAGFKWLLDQQRGVVEECDELREQIRKEEEAKARAEFERGQAILREEEENVRREDEERKATPAAPVRIQPKQAAPESRIKLGQINAAIAPLSITADGLAQLGFPHVGTDRAAKLYAESSFEAILSALAKTIARADLRREAA